MSRTLPLCLAALLLVTAAARGEPYRLETVAGDLHHPWSVAQLPDRSFLVTERRGQPTRVEEKSEDLQRAETSALVPQRDVHTP